VPCEHHGRSIKFLIPASYLLNYPRPENSIEKEISEMHNDNDINVVFLSRDVCNKICRMKLD